MRTLILAVWAMTLAAPAFSQREAVAAAFLKYKIDTVAVDSFTTHAYELYKFDLTTSIVTDGVEKVYKAQHDPNQGWVLQTVNDASPGRMDQSTFKKQHTDKIPPPWANKSTYQLIKDDGKELVIGFQYDPASLVADNEFMNACTITLHFDAKSGLLTKSEAEITESFKIKMFKADHLSNATTYQYMPEHRRYLPIKEEVSIGLKLLGRPLEMITVNEYSNYQK